MVTNVQNPEHRAEIFLCLSRAFLPPIADSAWEGMAEYLAADLRDIAAESGGEMDAAIDSLEEALRKVPDHQSLLLGYSDLYYTPPVRVHLNAGIYLDGAIMGPHTMGVQEIYARNGVARSDDFKDTPDHLAIQLEFLALLYARAAEEEETEVAAGHLKAARDFMRHFMTPWLPRFAGETESQAGDLVGSVPYIHLSALVRDTVGTALDELLELLPLTGEEEDVKAVEEDVVAARELPPAGSGLEMMKARLKEAGLDTSHLEVNQEERDFDLGMRRKRPVAIRKPGVNKRK